MKRTDDAQLSLPFDQGLATATPTQKKGFATANVAGPTAVPSGRPDEQRSPTQKKVPAAAPKLKVIEGLGLKKQERLSSRDAVARVLIEAGADLLLRRISSARAEAIEHEVDLVLELFDAVDRDKSRLPELQRRLDELEALVRETRDRRVPRRRLER